MDVSSHLRISFATDFPGRVCRRASIYNFWLGSILFLICVRDEILINRTWVGRIPDNLPAFTFLLGYHISYFVVGDETVWFLKIPLNLSESEFNVGFLALQ